MVLAVPGVPIGKYGTAAAGAFVKTLSNRQLFSNEYHSVTDRFGDIEAGLLDAVIDVSSLST